MWLHENSFFFVIYNVTRSPPRVRFLNLNYNDFIKICKHKNNNNTITLFILDITFLYMKIGIFLLGVIKK